MRLVVLGDGRKREQTPAARREHVAGEVVLMQPLHDDGDRALLLVVEPRIERRIARDPSEHFEELSAIAAGYWPIVLTARRRYRVPVPPQLWIKVVEPRPEP
jgi:hypothetical protein